MDASTPPLAERLSVIVITHNRVNEVLRTLGQLHGLPQLPAIVVVDNGSTDSTTQRIRHDFPQVVLIRLPVNIGAAARNVGARKVCTLFVAFCDDDTWWATSALEHGCDLLDAHPQLVALSARVLVGPQEREDPTCTLMARSALPSAHLPGPAVMGFLAGASIFRRQAFLDAGGFNPRLFIGGEETLLTLDLASRGWQLAYTPQLVVHHHPSTMRDSLRRRQLLARNAIWIAWLRRPFASACRETVGLLAEAHEQGHLLTTLWAVARGMPWVWQNRQVIPNHVETLYRWRNRTGY